MSVNRLSAQTPQPDPGRLDTSRSVRRSAEQAEPEQPAPAPESARPTGDTVELSAASTSLVDRAGGSADAPPSGTLSAERLKQVLTRIEGNYYDRPEVRDTIANRVAKDLGPT